MTTPENPESPSTYENDSGPVLPESEEERIRREAIDRALATEMFVVRALRQDEEPT